MNKRKQKLEVKSEEMISAEPDLPMLGEEGSNWLFEDPNVLDIDNLIHSDMMLNLFSLPLEDEPLSQENKEIFQDLQYTSTPKSRPNTSRAFFDSGFEEPTPSSNAKSKTTYSVLHDITDKIDSTCNNSFINLSQLSEASSCDSTCKRRRIAILRKDLNTQPRNYSNRNFSRTISKEQLVYYSGITDYNIAVAILKHLKMPKGEVSSFKAQLITLIKLRLNLEWKDMSFRFSISDEIIMKLTKQTIDTMDISFNDFLPWHIPRKSIRRTQKSFFAQSLFCLKSNTQSLIVIIDDSKPVLFVSDVYSLETSPLLILNECSTHLIPGDVLCLCDIPGNVSFYKISHSSTGLGITALGETLSHCAFLDNCQKIVGNIITHFSILSKPEESLNLSKLVKIAGALTNINSLKEITPTQLQQIYNKSSQAAGVR